MEYVGPSYNYSDWMRLVQYTRSMRRYGLSVNYLQLKDKDKIKEKHCTLTEVQKKLGIVQGL